MGSEELLPIVNLSLRGSKGRCNLIQNLGISDSIRFLLLSLYSACVNYTETFQGVPVMASGTMRLVGCGRGIDLVW